MPPRRKEPSPAEADPGTDTADVEPNSDWDYKSGATIPQAMASIEKWKTKRSGIRKGIDEDYSKKLSALKNKISMHYKDKAQKISVRINLGGEKEEEEEEDDSNIQGIRSNHHKQQLERLMAAVEKRIECEEKISERIDSLRDDCAHIAMLLDAIYAGREEAATQAAKAANPDLIKN
ncbi:hypothetical protein AAE478_000309 [Parahypoxylon ruwenzoriense]